MELMDARAGRRAVIEGPMDHFLYLCPQCVRKNESCGNVQVFCLFNTVLLIKFLEIKGT